MDSAGITQQDHCYWHQNTQQETRNTLRLYVTRAEWLQVKEIPAQSAAWAKEFEEAAAHSSAQGYDDIWKHYGEVWRCMHPACFYHLLAVKNSGAPENWLTYHRVS